MNIKQLNNEDEYRVRTIDGPEGATIVADLGQAADGSVEIVDSTAIILADGRQHDIDLESEPRRAFIKNGILTIEQGDSQ